MTHVRLRSYVVLCVLCVLGFAPACASTGAPTPRATAELTPRDAVLFDDGVDFIGSALALEGHWREEWAQDLIERVKRADFISSVTVKTLRTDVAPQGYTTYRLSVEERDSIEGELPGGEATLTTTPESRGYRTVDARTSSLESGQYLLFGKWFADPDRDQRLRWHLAPDTDDVRAVVRKELGRGATQSHTSVTVRPLEE